MAERAHPEDPGFQGTIYEQKLRERYAACLPLVQGKDVLDVPCGTGWGTSMLTGCKSLAGLEVDGEAVRYALKNFPGIRFQLGRMEALPFADAEFDVVLCLEGIEHVYRGEAILASAEIWRVLRPGGRVVITTPLRADGRHSGNPYHLFEYTESELSNLLEPWFGTVKLECIQGPETQEIRYIGARRDVVAQRAEDVPDHEERHLHQSAVAWLAGLKSGAGFRFAAGCPQSLLATCIGTLLLEGAGGAQKTAGPERETLARYIQDNQDPETGLFHDPGAATAPAGSAHDPGYVEYQTTYFALQALDALGEQAPHPLAFLKEFGTPEAIAAWLNRLEWSNPWLESNRCMFLLSFLVYQAEVQRDQTAPLLYLHVLDRLDLTQDPNTGLWGTQDGASPLNAVAGAYHFIPFYEYVHRPVPHFGKIVDAALRLQREDGLFAPAPGGGACEDLDAVDVLATFTRQCNYRAEEIKRALVRAFWALWNLQNPDGGFPYARRTTSETYRFSSLPALETELRASDVWATWFRLAALNTIAATYPGELPRIDGWQFRRWPALGYHRRSWAIESAEAQTLPVWLKAVSASLALPQTTTVDVSVVITCFNLGRYLPEAIASARNQTLAATEILVVDDGSTDELTRLLLEELSAAGVQVIRQSNQGVAAARNAGIQLARAPYICCLDADDRLKPTYLEKAKDVLDRQAETGFVSCYYETFDGDRAVYRYDRCSLPEMLVQNEAVVASVFRKEAWERAGGYCRDLSGLQDWDFWVSILAAGYQGAVLTEVLFEYRVRWGSMYATTSRPENYSSIFGKIVQRHEELYGQNIPEVLKLASYRFAELLAVRRGEVDELTRAKVHFEEQAAAWQKTAEEGRKYNTELEGYKAWLESQVASWQRTAEDLQWQLTEAQERITLLEQRASGEGSETPPGIRHSVAGLLRTGLLLLSPSDVSSKVRNLAYWTRLRVLRQGDPGQWSAHFDAAYYRKTYPDVARLGVSPAIHYLLNGYREDRNPSTRFDGRYYRACHPDVRSAGLNPLLHFALFGAREGRTVAGVNRNAQAPILMVHRPGGPAQREEPAEGPLVSVIIPCFNYGEYVEAAIRSVLGQTLHDLEVIVVEGGSTDGRTPQIVKALEERRWPKTRFVYQSEPHLVGDNRNLGIKFARGRYICCLDADDILKPTYLEVAVYLAEAGGYDIVYPSLASFGQGQFRWLVADARFPEIAEHNQITTVALFRKSAWEEVGGFRDWGVREKYVPEDWELWVRLLGNGFRARCIPEPLMLYRVHDKGLYSTSRLPVEEQSRVIREANQELLKTGPRRRAQEPCRRVPQEVLDGEGRAAPPTILLALPFISIGGAEKLFRTLMRELIRRGYRVLAFTTLILPESVVNDAASFEAVSPYIYPLPALFGEDERRWKDFVYYMVARYKVQTVLLAGCEFFYRFLPEFSRAFPQVGVVDQLFNGEVHVPNNRRYSEYIHVTTVPSRALFSQLVEKDGAAPDSLSIIPHGMDLLVPSAEPRDALFEKSGLPARFKNKFLVSFFGRLSPEKAPCDFVEIAHLLDGQEDVCFCIAGDGPEKNAVLERIRLHRLEDRIHAPGFVENVPTLIELSEVVVLPSQIDGMPQTVMEAQCLGRPVIASAVGSLPDMIEDGKTGLLAQPGDVRAFAQHVLDLLRNPERRSALGEAASRSARSKFSAEVMTSAYLEAFEAARSRAVSRARLQLAGSGSPL